jgi:hypothetical protein
LTSLGVSCKWVIQCLLFCNWFVSLVFKIHPWCVMCVRTPFLLKAE